VKNINLALLLALISVSCSSGEKSGSSPKPATSSVPGTGVTFVVPANLRQGAMGAQFIDPSGETIVQFQVSSAPSKLEGDPPGPSLLIMPIPIPGAKHAAIMQPDKCASLFASSFRAGSYAGPFDVTENGIKACDAWGVESDGRTKYMSMMVMPNGALLSVMGWGDPDQFRASLMHMSMTRAAQPSPATKAP
jgi:hypothetical protein